MGSSETQREGAASPAPFPLQEMGQGRCYPSMVLGWCHCKGDPQDVQAMLKVGVGALQVTKHHSHSFLSALLGAKPERGDGLGIALSPKCLPARGAGSKGKWWQAKQCPWPLQTKLKDLNRLAKDF